MHTETDTYFLDTSTQINVQWEDDHIKKYLRNQLSHATCYCSEYVKNEYKSNIVNDTILAYNTVVDSETLDEAASRLKSTLTRIGRDPNDLPFKIYNRFFKQYKSKPPLLKKLEKIIEAEWLNYFYGFIKQELFKIVNCKSAQSQPQKYNKYYTITPTCPKSCNVTDFCLNRSNELQIISRISANKLSKVNDPKGTLSKARKAAISVLDGNNPVGEKCKHLSDFIISIEARDSHPRIVLFSMDGDFKLISEILKIPALVKLKHDIKE